MTCPTPRGSCGCSASRTTPPSRKSDEHPRSRRSPASRASATTTRTSRCGPHRSPICCESSTTSAPNSPIPRKPCVRSGTARSTLSSSVPERGPNACSRSRTPTGRTATSSRTCLTARRQCRPRASCLYANQAFADLVALASHQVVGRPVLQFVTDASQARLADMLSPDSLGASVEASLCTTSGNTVPVRISSSSALQVDGAEIICLTVMDLTRERVAEAGPRAFGAARRADQPAESNIADGSDPPRARTQAH